jgi:hypothetical protein
MEATVRVIMARVLAQQGDLAAAHTAADESLTFFRSSGNAWGIAIALYMLGVAATEAGESARARALYEEGLELQRELADSQGMLRSLVDLAEAAIAERRIGAARQYLHESLVLATRAGDGLALLRGLDGCARLLATDCSTQAVRLGGAADALRVRLGAGSLPAERHRRRAWLTTARKALGATTCRTSWTAGQALDGPQAAAEATQLLSAAESAGAERTTIPCRTA